MPAFATADEVETRRGRTLSTAERATATAVIEAVTGLIAEAVGQDEEWAADLIAASEEEGGKAIPRTLRQLCVEKAIATIANPDNVASESKTLGAFSHSATYPRGADIGVFLSADEVTRVRRAIAGISRGSARLRSIVDDLAPARAIYLPR